MGVGVSGWRLASAVARAGQLGVVSGVALDTLVARRLQRGDPDGTVRRALAHLPIPAMAERVVDRYFVPGGIAAGRPFRPVPRLAIRQTQAATDLAIAGTFVEVFLAKEGHGGQVGVNFLEKVQLATPAAAYGAMLAGVDYVLMGAGIPAEIPHLLDMLATHCAVELTVTVDGALAGERYVTQLDPTASWAAGGSAPPAPLARPIFLAIVSSAVLALYLARDASSRPDGFVLEGPIAGGHSAPPRGKLVLDSSGEPVYGPRDAIDTEKVAAIGLPFWLAGGCTGPEQVRDARSAGAVGVQIGSAFALCQESGLDETVRRQLIDQALRGDLVVRNEPFASPTGFPFKVAQLPATVSDEVVYSERPRLCDIGYLRTPYRKANGSIGYHCQAEPVDTYVRKGGDLADTEGRRCLCNGLVATIGLGQHRADGYAEPPLVTLGQDVGFLRHLLGERPGGLDYTALDVINYLTRDPSETRLS